MSDECKHLWQVVPPDGMAEGYWRCRFCGATQDDPLELDSAPPRTDLPDAGDILHRINTQTSLGSVFGSQTDPETLYMPTSLICRLLDGEDA